jgi:hypothetical protein
MTDVYLTLFSLGCLGACVAVLGTVFWSQARQRKRVMRRRR